MTAIAPSSIEEVRDAVAAHPRVGVRGGGSKPALCVWPDDAAVIDMRRISGIVEYDPGEYTFTALAGTPVRDVLETLAAHGQALPFDPPFASRGATLGGTVAAGLSGPGRYRNGGVRDFILGVRFVSGAGLVIKGGGKVVKNAAGFDLPKLMVGSLGRLGVLVEMSFKVFPRPEARGTLVRILPSVRDGVELVRRLGRTAWDIDAIDIDVAHLGTVKACIRLGGLATALRDRLERLRAELGGGELVLDAADEAMWHDARELTWVADDATLVKVPLTPARVSGVEALMASTGGPRRYSAGCQVAWLAWGGTIESLDADLRGLSLAGLAIRGPRGNRSPLIGALDGGAFATRVIDAMDPQGRFS